MTRPDKPVETDPLEMLRDMRRKLRFLVIATVLSYVVAGGIALFAWALSETLRSGVCTLRGDLEARVADTREYLRDNPNGLEQFGVSREALRESVINQERTVTALDNIRC